MNWGIKDENMKNMLWSERCRKDVQASEGAPRGAWSVQPSSLERNMLSRDVKERDRRFLNAGPSLLASLSRFVADTNVTPQAAFVRSFSAMRKDKLSRPSMRLHGHRAASANGGADRLAATAATPATAESTTPAMAQSATPPDGGAHSTLEARSVKPRAVRPTTALPVVRSQPLQGHCANTPPALPAVDAPTTPSTNAAPTLHPQRHDIRRPLSAAMFSHRPTSAPKWQHPMASSDVYGWQPTSAPAPYTDRRFQHPLSTTDVTRMGSMGATKR